VVTARNRGRAPVDIDRFYFAVGKSSANKNISWVTDDDPPLPQRLEPASSACREYIITEIEAFTRREKRRRFRGAVSLGDGHHRRSRKSFNIDRRRRGRAFLKSSIGQTLSTALPAEQRSD
jgi:hypothetical protein